MHPTCDLVVSTFAFHTHLVPLQLGMGPKKSPKVAPEEGGGGGEGDGKKKKKKEKKAKE